MKKTISLILAVFCIVAIFAGCRNNEPVYVDGTVRFTEDTTLGSGSKTITVTVKDNEGKEVKFTIKTDAKTVGEALLENKVIAGEDGQYGMYIKVVNGLRADYDKDHAYWSFIANGEVSMTGVDTTDLIDGGNYELVYKVG
ncbi:MAG: DUF4430 domain-containing protein [Ruminococcaceae bacterium]|nr:DUF4430 domain-containing protein [Oscillospiraceae bacterium]